MAPILSSLALFLAPASVLSAEAAEYNAKAMRFYDAGQLAPAVDEFFAAYQSMPDARRDHAGREQLLGSMRSTLLDLHAQTGEAAPLCRLQDILQGHTDALALAYPDDPNSIEIRRARALHLEVTRQLAAFGPDVCKPPPPPPESEPARTEPLPAETPTPAPVVPTLAPPGDNPLPRRLQLAGGILVPLGVVVLGVVAGDASGYRRDLARADDLYTELVHCRCDDAGDRSRLQELLATTRRDEGLMVALGVTGGALLTAGTALLVRGSLQRRGARLGLDLRQHRVGLTISGEF